MYQLQVTCYFFNGFTSFIDLYEFYNYFKVDIFRSFLNNYSRWRHIFTFCSTSILLCGYKYEKYNEVTQWLLFRINMTEEIQSKPVLRWMHVTIVCYRGSRNHKSKIYWSYMREIVKQGSPKVRSTCIHLNSLHSATSNLLFSYGIN